MAAHGYNPCTWVGGSEGPGIQDYFPLLKTLCLKKACLLSVAAWQQDPALSSVLQQDDGGGDDDDFSNGEEPKQN